MIRMRLTVPVTLGTLVASAPAAWAHPGEHHQGWSASLMHLLSEPDHVAMLLLAIGAGIVLARLWRRRSGRGRSES